MSNQQNWFRRDAPVVSSTKAIVVGTYIGVNANNTYGHISGQLTQYKLEYNCY